MTSETDSRNFFHTHGAIMKSSSMNRTVVCLASLLTASCLLLITGCSSTQQAAPVTQKEYAFWPTYPDPPHIQYLTSFSRASDLAPPMSDLDKLIYGKETLKDLPINKPYGVDMHDGKIYVCDLRNDCVVILNLRTQKTYMMGTRGGQTLQNPNAISIASDGFKYVADMGRGRIFVFDQNDAYFTAFGPEGLKPAGVFVSKDELYVTDFNTSSVLVLNRHDGRLIRQIGEAGGAPGQFVKPVGVAVDPAGDIFVTDVIRCHVSRFKHDGTYVSTFGGMSDRVGGMVRPKHMAIDKDGIIYVVDASFQNVQLFNNVGNIYAFFGSAGGHPGAMNLPAGISIHEGDLDLFQKYVHPDFVIHRLILVTNQFGPNRVAVYGLGELKPGKTPADVVSKKSTVPTGVKDPNNNTPNSPLPAITEGEPAPNLQPSLNPVTTQP